MLAAVETATIALPYKEKVARLKAMLPPSACEVTERLQRARYFIQLLNTFYEVYPVDYAKEMEGVTIRLGGNNGDEEDFIYKLLRLVETGLFPIDVEGTADQFFYNGGSDCLYIYIQPCGMPVSDEEIEEGLSTDNPPPYSSLEMLCLLINSGMAGPIHWRWAARHFGWRFMPPKSLVKQPNTIDWKLFYEKLESAGLSCVRATFDIVTRTTENIFLDYNPYDQTVLEVAYELPFEKETLERLSAAWKEAEPRLEESKKAIEMMDKDPKIGGQIVKLWNQCCTFKQPKEGE